MQSRYGFSRPPVMGTRWMVSSGHYLATMAGVRMLENGGNAIDAGVATGMALNVVHPDMTSFGGVAPIIIYCAKSDEVVTISGLGWWPKAATLEFFAQKCGGDLPLGVLRSVVPAAADAWITALDLYGTKTFREVVQPALQLAEDGFPCHKFMADTLSEFIHVYRQFPSSARVFLREGKPPKVGELIVQKELAKTFRIMMGAEEKAAGDRHARLAAARDAFYAGAIAKKWWSFANLKTDSSPWRIWRNFGWSLSGRSKLPITSMRCTGVGLGVRGRFFFRRSTF